MTPRTCAHCGERDAVTTEPYEGRIFAVCASCLTPACPPDPYRPQVGAANCTRVLEAARKLGTFEAADLAPLTGLTAGAVRRIARALCIDGDLRLVQYRQGGRGGGSRYAVVAQPIPSRGAA